uniref:Tryptophan synthase alpha chain n=1 Tax=Harveyella mirabilis TaxID=282355 RepID=A0A3S8UW19_9FLOR|nr:tryptophan synthase alpha subunit [Harveyella mirabilis]
MNPILKVLQQKRKIISCALIPFLTAGYPNIDLTIKALITLNLKGADIIELGIPYSDALADGPLIQKSSKIALQQGTYINEVLYILSKVQYKLNAPIVIFTYYNPILVRGIHKFILEIVSMGVKGLIIPDLPIEEIDYLNQLCFYYKIELILFITPTNSFDRILEIISKASSCIYLVSNTGVTGLRDYVNNDINILSNYIKSYTNKFLILGFGISSPIQVSQISAWNIDGIVMGSAFTGILSSDFANKESTINIINNLGSFCKEIKTAIKDKKIMIEK